MTTVIRLKQASSVFGLWREGGREGGVIGESLEDGTIMT
jgi:hypothetical protein